MWKKKRKPVSKWTKFFNKKKIFQFNQWPSIIRPYNLYLSLLVSHFSGVLVCVCEINNDIGGIMVVVGSLECDGHPKWSFSIIWNQSVSINFYLFLFSPTNKKDYRWKWMNKFCCWFFSSWFHGWTNKKRKKKVAIRSTTPYQLQPTKKKLSTTRKTTLGV